MFRATVKALNLSQRVCNSLNLNISHSEFNVQSVRRWRHRRPLALGTSKSKLFKIPQHPKHDPEEQAEMMRLQTIYSDQMTSLHAFFAEEKKKRDEAKVSKTLADEEDYEQTKRINDEWNKNVAKIREARLKAERIAMQEEIMWQLDQQREYEEEQRRLTNEMVLREKEAAKSFIVRENFDEALEMALEKKTDFNFAIDDQGNIYPGRTGTDIITPQSE